MKLAGERLRSFSPAILILENAADYFARNRKSKELIIPGSIPFSQQKRCLAINIATLLARDPLIMKDSNECGCP